MAMWTRIDSDPPECMAPDGYANAGLWVGLLFCAIGAALGAWLAWG